jgi:hypothetical protein
MSSPLALGMSPILLGVSLLIAAAQELRDCWLEHVSAAYAELLPRGKYDITRMIGAGRVEFPAVSNVQRHALPPAA